MSQSSAAAEPSAEAGGGEFMLFGFRVVVDSMRKSVSLNNLSDYQQTNTNNNVNKDDVVVAAAADAGYASADDAVPRAGNGARERKRGIPWTEEEHKLFLLGLKKVGKGDWRGISKNFVKTRTPTQVASHAQKYFLRRNNHNRRRRRSSMFDITTESIAATSEKEHDVCQEKNSLTQPLQPPQLEAFKVGGFQMMTPYPVNATAVMPIPADNTMARLIQEGAEGLHSSFSSQVVRPRPSLHTPEDSRKSDLNLNLNLAMDPPELSLNLSLPSNHSAFQAMSNFNNGQNVVSVA